MEGYVPIGTGYKPIGTGYNRAKGEYGFTGVLEDIKNNNLFKGEFNNRTATQVKQGVLSGATPRTGWNGATTRQPSVFAPPSSQMPSSSGGFTSGLTGQDVNITKTPQDILGSSFGGAASLLRSRPVASDVDRAKDINNDGVIDPFEE